MLDVIDLGRIAYPAASLLQNEHVERVVASRQSPAPIPGVILLVEHEPVITVSRRPTAAGNVLASPAALAAAGVVLADTDRGGDVTYHGPGQLVVYPIIDLNAHHLRIVDYIRLLEAGILDALSSLGVTGNTDPAATGVWIARAPEPPAKIAAIGVRIRHWVSMHGLSINVTPDLGHFDLIVPCGLHGRPVTSLERELGAGCPPMSRVKSAITEALQARLAARRASA